MIIAVPFIGTKKTVMTPAPTPLKKTDDLLKSINLLKIRKEEINQFEFASLKREIKKLKSVDLRDMWMLLGMVAVLEGNIDEMHHCHQTSLNFPEGLSDSYRNYAISLETFGLYTQAIDMLQKAYQLDEGNPKIISDIITCYLKSGQLSNAKKWVLMWEKEKPNEEYEFKDIINYSLNFINENDISENDFKIAIEYATAILRDEGIWIYDWNTNLKNDETSEWLSWTMNIKSPTTKLVDLTVRYANKISELNISSNLISNIVIGYATVN